MNRFHVFLLSGVLASSTVFAADGPSAELIRKGDALDLQFKTAASLEAYLQAEKLDPGNSDLLRRVSREYALSMNDTASKEEKRRLGEQALDYARRAVAADSKNAMAQLALAICYGRLAPLLDNKTKIAYSKLVKEHADKALVLDPNADYAYHVLGAWNYEMANLSLILRAVVKVVYGGLPPASNEVALKHFRKAVELAPQRVAHHIELGRTYAALGNKEEARTSLNKGLALPNREKDDADTKVRGREALGKL